MKSTKATLLTALAGAAAILAASVPVIAHHAFGAEFDPNTIMYRFTVEDPDTWERPWSGEYPWIATSEPLYEYACHEGNYALSGVLKGARLQDKERPAAR